MRNFNINGEASIASGTGVADALEELGISVDGVTITLEEQWDGVKIDTYGSKIDVDSQQMLMDVKIKAELIYVDMAVLRKWQSCGSPGAAQTFGQFISAGQLAVANGLSARLLVRSTPNNVGINGDNQCWNFPNAVLIDATECKIGVKLNPWVCVWKAYPDLQTSTTHGAVLFNNICI